MRTTLSTSDAIWQHPLAQYIQSALQGFSSEQRFVIACSGGRDSLVLADLMVKYAINRVRLLHVNHQLHPDASTWAEQVQKWAIAHGVSCTVCAVQVAQGNLEAEARAARYAAFLQDVQPDEVLVMAHHQQDQAETLLMRLFSGSGVQGLSAMKSLDQYGGLRRWRPLLGWSRAQINAFAELRGLPYVDDPANQVAQYDRVFLRQAVFPVLQQRWPSVAQSISRTAELMQNAAEILAEVAAQDWQTCRSVDGLSVPALTALSAARQRQLVAYWMQGDEVYAPPLHRVLAVLQLASARGDGRVVWHTWQFRYYQSQLYRLSLHASASEQTVCTLASLALGQVVQLASGRWQVQPVMDGLPMEYLAEPLRLLPRQGGERLHLEGRVGHWPLKKFLQQLSLPVWQREQVQLLYRTNALESHTLLAVLTPKGCFLTAEARQQGQTSWRLQRV